MTRTTQRRLGIITIVAATVAVSAYVHAQVTTIPVTPDDEQRSPEKTRLTMESKLIHSQKVLEGLVRHDFEAIERAAGVLREISLSPPPEFKKASDDADAQVYEHFRMEFARLAGELERHAHRKEPEATAYVQQNMTATCIACHDYIRDYP